MAARSLFRVITKPATWALGLDKPDSIATIVRQCRHTLGVSRDFLESPSAILVNPQHRPIKSDTTSLSLTASTFHGLSDEKLLALFTKGFFGGWVFFLESLALKAGVWKLSPVTFTGFEDRPGQREIWVQSSVPSTSLLTVGDTLFRTFKLIDIHIASQSNSGPSLSYLDFGFGQNQSTFAGCHRFQIVRIGTPDSSSADKTLGEEALDLSIECFIYDPQSAMFDKLAWFHHLYVELLFVGGVQSCFQGK